MPDKEKYFPRGRKEPPKEQPKESSHLLKRKRDSLDASTNKKAKEWEENHVNNLSLKTLRTLSEGMVIIGYVREVSSLQLRINLPGLRIGYVPSTNISEEYSSYLKALLSGEEKEPQELTDMFKHGQLVVARVVEIITETDNTKLKTKVSLSLNPKVIQRDLSVDDVVKGFMLSASVLSNEDHVYVMNCGIPGVRAVLKKAQALNYQNIWNDGKPLGVGQVIRCLVTKCSTSDGSSTVELTADPKTLSEACEETTVPLNSMILGRCFQLSVEKVFSSGLVVNLSDHTGYINSNYLKVNFRNIEENSFLKGRVMYIEPLTRNIFLTALCGPTHPLPPFEKIKKGTIFSNAKVISSKGGNILLELEEISDDHGVVSYHHLDIDENIKTVTPYAELVKEKYPPESSHECKVLEYDYMTQKYICTLKRSIIKQTFSSLDELAPGLVTKCIVERSSPRGIYLRLWSIRGFVEPLQCSDLPVRDPESLFEKGQMVEARVLVVKNSICEFTLKPALVKSKNPILTKFSDANYGVEYDGVIVLITTGGVLVKFFGDFKTFVSASRVLGGKRGHLEELYYVGQVVKCHVKQICDEEEKLVLNVQSYESEQLKNKIKKKKTFLKVGRPYNVIVKEVTPEGLIVQEHEKGVMGRIPSTQLTDSPQISSLLCQTYNEGDKLQTYCLNVGCETLFTLSPTFIKYFETPSGEELCKKGLSGLEERMVVPSLVAEISADELILTLPMVGETCSVSWKEVCQGILEDIQALEIQKHQTVMVRILRIFEGSILGTCKLQDVCDRAVMSEYGIMLLQDFMKSQKRIHDHWKRIGNPLGELKIGSQVEGTVIAVQNLGIVVDLDNGARAVVMPVHIDKDLNLEVHTRVKGTVMYLDIVNQCVQITLWKHVHDMFSLYGKVLDVGKSKRGFVLISRPDILVCGIKHFQPFYITYVPSRWHVNDFCPTPYFPVGVRETVTIRACSDDMMFAIPRKLEIYEKMFKSKKEPELIANGADNVENNVSDEVNMGLEVKAKMESEVEDEVGESFSQPQVDSSGEKQKNKKGEKRNSHEKSVNNNKILEESTVSLNKEKLTEVEIKSKKQKKKSKIDKSLNSTISSDLPQPIEENIEHVGTFENEKQKRKKKKKKNNSLENSVSEIKITEICNNTKLFDSTQSVSNELLAEELKSKKQKKKKESIDLSEENLYAPLINNEVQKKSNSLEKSVKDIEIMQEIVEIVNRDEDGSRNEIEGVTNNSQTSDITESINYEYATVLKKRKKRKKKGGVDNSWTVVAANLSNDMNADGTNTPHLFEENHTESVINNNENEPQIKKKKNNTENPLLNHHNEIVEEKNELISEEHQSRGKYEETGNSPGRNKQNSPGDKMKLIKEIIYGKEKKNSSLKKKANERKNENENNSPKIYQCPETEESSYLNVSAGFFWNASPDQLPAVAKQKRDDAESGSEVETEVIMNKKKKQRLTAVEKKELARQEEERLRKIEERLMDAEENPVSADDFDRLVMTAPNNSQNWIKYMAYHLEATEVGKAQAVAERALKTISFWEEQEKLNVWIALLNLENLYGTQESFDRTLEEAVKTNDSYKVHMQVLNMYSMTKKLEELDKTVQLVTKKYRDEKNTWIEAGLACIKCGEVEKSRNLMQRALKILNKKYHVEVITRFARMENEWGEPERAETLMENILTSYPKRIDVWNVYVDMLVKSKKIDIARQVLDRAVIQKLHASKMKSLFQKYLTFEETYGTPDRVKKVREMAKNFVENLKSDIG